MKVVKTVNFYTITNYSGTTKQTWNYGMDYPQATKVLPDGSSVGIHINASAIHFFIDTNGPDKGPNRFGFDIFQFTVNDSTDAIKAIKQSQAYSDEELEGMKWAGIAGSPCNKTSTQAGNGRGCSYYAVNDINPDDENKHYWTNLPW